MLTADVSLLNCKFKAASLASLSMRMNMKKYEKMCDPRCVKSFRIKFFTSPCMKLKVKAPFFHLVIFNSSPRLLLLLPFALSWSEELVS